MELSNPFKLVPSSMYVPLAIVAGGLLAWRFLFSGGDSGDVSNPTSPSMGYDPSLVALGVQTSLERDKLAASTELGKLAIATEMHALDVQSDMQAREVGLADTVNSREVGLADTVNSREQANNYQGILSQERMFGADLSLKNSELSVMQNIGMAEQETARLVSFNDVEKARVAGNASVAAAKAGKSKSIGFGKFKLSF